MEVFKSLFQLQLDAVHFMWLLTPLKERWCPHAVLLLFFAGLMWNSFMASWACSMSNSFTQDASIEWYPFHFTKYSHSCLLSYLAFTVPRLPSWNPNCPELTVSRLQLRSPGKKCHLDVASVESCKEYYMGEDGGFPRVWAVVSFVCQSARGLSQHPRVFPNAN